jgi:probable HAF family extracellular repeat protein
MGGVNDSLKTDQSFALGINNTDQVVGYTFLHAQDNSGVMGSPVQVAFIYSNGVMTNLNTLVGRVAANTYQLYSATAINDKGQIAVTAFDYDNNVFRALLLTPMASSKASRPGPVASTVVITRAEYSAIDKLLLIQARVSSDNGTARETVQAFTSDGQLIGNLMTGTLKNSKAGTYVGNWSGFKNNPKEITVTSSLGGTASSPVTEILPGK